MPSRKASGALVPALRSPYLRSFLQTLLDHKKFSYPGVAAFARLWLYTRELRILRIKAPGASGVRLRIETYLGRLSLKDGLAGSEEDWLSRLRPGTQEYVEIFAKTMEGDVCTADESD